MKPPYTSIFARSTQPHIPDYSITRTDADSERAAPRDDGARFRRKPYSPPQLELLEDPRC